MPTDSKFISKGRGRGTALRDALQKNTLNISPGKIYSDTPTDAIVKKMLVLSEADIISQVLPDVKKLQQTDLEHLVSTLGQRALTDLKFTTVAAGLLSKLWDCESEHSRIRPPLLRQMQSFFKNREEFRKDRRYHGLCIYLCQLFASLRIGGNPLEPIAVCIVKLLSGLIDDIALTSDNDAFFFYKQLILVGGILSKCAPEKLNELIDLARQLAITADVTPIVRCRLVQVVELNAYNWNESEDLRMQYEELFNRV